MISPPPATPELNVTLNITTLVFHSAFYNSCRLNEGADHSRRSIIRGMHIIRFRLYSGAKTDSGYGCIMAPPSLPGGEHLECHALIGFVCESVISPLATSIEGFEANGLRRLEDQVPDVAATLASALSKTDAQSQGMALQNIATLYMQLRNRHADNHTLSHRLKAQEAAWQFTVDATKAAIAREKPF